MAGTIRHKRMKSRRRRTLPTMTIKRFKTEDRAQGYKSKMWGAYDIDIGSTQTVKPKFEHGDKVGVTVLAGVKNPGVIVVKKPGAKMVNKKVLKYKI